MNKPVGRWVRGLLWMLCAAWGLGAAAEAQSPVKSWRAQHEQQIVDELVQLVSLPNVSGNDADMRKNADLLTAMFTKRGFKVETTSGPGSPVVFATLKMRRKVPSMCGFEESPQSVAASEPERSMPTRMSAPISLATSSGTAFTTPPSA